MTYFVPGSPGSTPTGPADPAPSGSVPVAAAPPGATPVAPAAPALPAPPVQQQPVGPPAGWYPDGATPGVVRWYDGVRWTEHVQPVHPAPRPTPEPSRFDWSSPSAARIPTSRTPYVAPQGPATSPYGAASSPYGQAGVHLDGRAGAYPYGQVVASPYGASTDGWADTSPYATGASAYGQPGVPPWEQAPAPGPDHGPSSAAHWLLPVGRSWQSIAAGYLGIVGLFVPVVAPFAIWTGAVALQRARNGGHGRGRAVFGIVGGVIGLTWGLFALIGHVF